MKRFLLVIAALAAFSTVYAETVAVTRFKGINSNENSVILNQEFAQDALNVDVTPGGASVKKRFGYGVYQTLPTSQNLHGGWHFFDSSGNDVQVWGSSTSLYGIVSDATATQLVSSATIHSTWDCTDTQGFAYCVNSNRNALIKTNGATQSWYTSPLGTMIEATPSRLVVAGVVGSPNTLYFSQSGTFTNFTIGLNETDPFTASIASPGSKLTHIRWGCGKLLWWKDQSFGAVDYSNQYDIDSRIISDSIGTFDNTSAIDPGGNVWFRGQDGHIYKYDCSALTKESIEVTPNIQASGRRVTNSWTQTATTDWQGGTAQPTSNFSYTASPGDVTLTTMTATESTLGTFTGSFSNTMRCGASNDYVCLSTNSAGTFINGDFDVSLTGSWTSEGTNGWSQTTATSFTCGSVTPQNGAGFAYAVASNATGGRTQTLKVLDYYTNATLSVSGITDSGDCVWRQQQITDTGSMGKRVKVVFTLSSNTDGAQNLITNQSYIWPGHMKFYYISQRTGTGYALAIDNITESSSTITSGTYTSGSYDTGLSSTVVQLQASWTVNTTTPYIELQGSNNQTSWDKLTTSTGTNISVPYRYYRYLSTFTIGYNDYALTSLQSASIVAISTGGVYLSSVKNSPNLTSWSTFGANASGSSGSHNFYIRSSASSFNATDASPSWVAVTNGSLISTTAGKYLQFRDDFTVISSTAQPVLSDVTINWYEGTATDQAYMLYFDNAIWASVAYGVGASTNNYIFKYDLINEGWTLYDFGAGGLVQQANTLYFGSTNSGGIYNYGTVKADNGSAIRAYWRSKSFSGQDPFLQNQLDQIDTFAKKDQGTTLTATYTTDTSSSTAYSISLSTTNSVVQNRKLLPSGKLGYVFDIQYGDSSTSSQWEIFGYRIGFTPLPYRPTR